MRGCVSYTTSKKCFLSHSVWSKTNLIRSQLQFCIVGEGKAGADTPIYKKGDIFLMEFFITMWT